MHFNRMPALIALALIVSACSSGGGGGSSGGGGGNGATPATVTGVFVDSTVAGIQYFTQTKSGVTNSAGEYDYLPGETVTFKIGDIVVGSAPAGPVVTPLTLVSGATDETDPIVTNIVRLLLTLDDDGNPDNGISIPTSTLTAAAGLSVDFTIDPVNLGSDTGVSTLLTAVSAPPLVDSATAQTHFAQTLASTWGSMTWGTGTWMAKTP